MLRPPSDPRRLAPPPEQRADGGGVTRGQCVGLQATPLSLSKNCPGGECSSHTPFPWGVAPVAASGGMNPCGKALVRAGAPREVVQTSGLAKGRHPQDGIYARIRILSHAPKRKRIGWSHVHYDRRLLATKRLGVVWDGWCYPLRSTVRNAV